MSNVTIMASEETGLEVDVVLGANVRKTHEVPGGDVVELTVGGGQYLTVRAASNVAPTADVPTGVDVSDESTEVVPGGDEDCGDGSGRTNLEKAADDEAAAGGAAALGADLFAPES